MKRTRMGLVVGILALGLLASCGSSQQVQAPSNPSAGQPAVSSQTDAQANDLDKSLSDLLKSLDSTDTLNGVK